ncbi:MAG: hypothetical protein IJ366_04400 [Clostridia bacterium]|nr:hypothetical protein [Clostridia bacterium]
MSERSYWKARPSARTVHDERVRIEDEKNFELLSQGVYFAAAILGVFGVCLGNIELICASAAMVMFARTLR